MKINHNKKKQVAAKKSKCNGRKLSEAKKKNIAGKQYYKCANEPGFNLKGLKNFQCPLWENKNIKKQGCFNESGYEIDHIIEHCLTKNDEDDNLQALCKMCHSVKTKRFLISGGAKKLNKCITYKTNKNNKNCEDNSNDDNKDNDSEDDNKDNDSEDDSEDDKDNNSDDDKNNDSDDDNNNDNNSEDNNSDDDNDKQTIKCINKYKCYQCKKCKYKTNRKADYTKHVNRKFDCRTRNYNYGIKNYGSKTSKPNNKCPYCKNIYSRSDYISKHIIKCPKAPKNPVIKKNTKNNKNTMIGNNTNIFNINITNNH